MSTICSLGPIFVAFYSLLVDFIVYVQLVCSLLVIFVVYICLL